MWNTYPNIQIFVTTKFDDVDITDPNVKISNRLSNDYIFKRLVPVHPKKPFNDKRYIVTRSATPSPATIIDTYLLLIPIDISNETKVIQTLKPALEYFDGDDFTYIKDLMRRIVLEEINERVSTVRNIDHPLVLNNDDNDSSSSSIPTSRNCSIETNIPSSHERISTWICKSIFE